MTALTGADDDGAVAAEFAVTIPAAILVILVGVGALGASAQSVRLQDAAADAARLIARDEPPERAAEVAGSAGEGVALTIASRGDLVCVTLASEARILGLPSFGVMLSATSCALAGGL